MGLYEQSVDLMCAVHALRNAGQDLTPRELQFLRESEPGLKLVEAEETLGVSQGRQSRVSVLEYQDGGVAEKVIWKRMGVGKHLTNDEALLMHQRLLQYKRSLEAFGWTIPELLYTKLIDVSDNESQIFSYEQFIEGGDGDALLANPDEPNFRKWHFVRQTLEQLYRYPDDSLERVRLVGKELTGLPHGLDLKAANLVLERSTNKLHFVDLFAPKELKPDGSWEFYSPKIDHLAPDNLRAICATREGMIVRFWRLARRLWEPDHARRRLLTDDLLDHLSALQAPEREIKLIEKEIRAGFPWLTAIYQEHYV